MKGILTLFVFLVIVSSGVKAEVSKTIALGADLGFSADFLVPIETTGSYGLGLGYHLGVYGIFEKNSEWPIKARLESISLRETATSASSTDDVISGTKLKSLEQKWWVLSAGVEKRWAGDGRIWFWEFLAGYGFGQPTQVTLENYALTDQMVFTSSNTNSGFILSTGIGFRRQSFKHLQLVMSARTMLPILTSFHSGPIGGKKYFVFPALFSLGVEY